MEPDPAVSELATHAANYAADRGFRVFPCRDKRPLTSHGFKDARTDPELVERMFEYYRGAQIGIATGGGIWVLDVDGEEGEASLARISEGRPIYTAVVRTARGRHYWFRGDGLGSRSGVLPGIDTRGEGGYVIAPPSIHETGWQYRWEVPLDDLAEAPSWLIEALKVQGSNGTVGTNHRSNVQADPAAVEIPISDAEDIRIHTALGRIDMDDYQTWVEIGMALQSTRAGSQAFHIWDKWSAGSSKYPGSAECWAKWCSFGRREHEITLGTLFHRAGADAREPETPSVGAQNSQPPQPEAAAPFQMPPPPGPPAKPVSPIETLWDLSPPEWMAREMPTPRLYLLLNPDGSGMLPRNKAGTFTAQGGIGKTMAIVQLALSVATGRPWLGHFIVDPNAPKRVLLLLGEEDREEVYRRLYYAAAGMNLSDEEWQAACSLIIAVPLAGKPTPLLSLSRDVVAETYHLAALRSLLEAEGGWGLVVLDPLARFAGVDAESSNLLATRFVQAVEALCDVPGGPTLLVVGHSSKNARKEGKADARGVTALTDGFRWHATLTPLPKDDALNGCVFTVEKNNYGVPIEPLTLVRRDHGILSTASEAERSARAAAATEKLIQCQKEKERTKETADEERMNELVSRVVAIVTERPGVNNSSLRGALGGKTTRAGMAISRAVLSGSIYEHRVRQTLIRYYIDEESAELHESGIADTNTDEAEEPNCGVS